MSKDTQDLIVGIITILVIVALVILWFRHSNKKTRANHWKGTVSEKQVSTSTDDDGNVSHTFHLTITQDGELKPRKITVNRSSYESFTVGDAIEKKLGELQPSKVAPDVSPLK